MSPTQAIESTELLGPQKLRESVSILLVDDDRGAIKLMARILADVGILRFATNGADALRLAHESAPDLILLDAEMPGMNGFDLLKELKAEAALAAVPVIFITGHSEPDFEVSALEMGAADYVTKPINPPSVLARVHAHLRLKYTADELRRAATTDSLTGLSNRRVFDETLEREWRRTRRTDEALALLLIDIDHFKLFNDQYGHPAGDVCLRCVAQALLGSCRRPADLVARYGGEEFVALLPHTPPDGAQQVAQRMLESVAALSIPHAASRTGRYVSISVGVAYYGTRQSCTRRNPQDRADELSGAFNAGDLLLAADEALYSAKEAGRAQVGFSNMNERLAP